LLKLTQPVVRCIVDFKKQEQQQQQQQDIASILSRYEDPVIREGYYRHELETIHNRILTIVFWDISGFSNLCNV
jgi:hypothetical protein